jgi:hypothetical protein
MRARLACLRDALRERRVALFPADWIELGDRELEALCKRGVPVTPSRRLVE